MSVFRKDLFQGKVGVVSGGGTGIGKRIAFELLALGAKVVIASRKEENLKATVEEAINTLGVPADHIKYFKCNTREELDVKELFEFVLKEFGRVDFLVNNAGGQFPAPAETIATKGWKSVIDLNLNGTFVMSREALITGKMAELGGAIVNITCDMNNGFPGMAHTGAARAGVTNLTKTLSVEWAKYGVRVNCVAPSVIVTSSAAAHYEEQTGNPEFMKQLIPFTPARRTGTEEEVSSAVMFLLSPGAAYISGVSIDVSGAGHLCPRPWSPETTGSDPEDWKIWPKYESKL